MADENPEFTPGLETDDEDAEAESRFPAEPSPLPKLCTAAEAQRWWEIGNKHFHVLKAKRGFPAHVTGKQFDAAELKEWLVKNVKKLGGEGAKGTKIDYEIKQARLRKLTVEAQAHEIKRDKELRKIMVTDEVYAVMGSKALEMNDILVARLERELPVKMEGLTLDERRSLCSSVKEDVCKVFNELFQHFKT